MILYYLKGVQPMEKTMLNRFLGEINVGNTLMVSPSIFNETKFKIRAVYNDYFALLKPDEAWDDEAILVDYSSIQAYRLIDHRSHQAPFQVELDLIIKKISNCPSFSIGERTHFIQYIKNQNPDVKKRVDAIYASSCKAKDAYSIDENIRKCNKAIVELGADPSFIALRGYNRYRDSLIKDSQESRQKAKEDFLLANYARGLFFVAKDDLKDEDKCSLLLFILKKENEIDENILFNYIRLASREDSISYLRENFNKDFPCHTEALIYLVKQSTEAPLYFPNESDLFSAQNQKFLLSCLPATAPCHIIEDLSSICFSPQPTLETPIEPSTPTPTTNSELTQYTPKTYTGSIVKLFAEKFGFIRLDDECNFLEKGQLFFHISSICSDVLRRELFLKTAKLSPQTSHTFPVSEYPVRFHLFENTQLLSSSRMIAGEITPLNPMTEDDTKKKIEKEQEVLSDSIVHFVQYNWSGKPSGQGRIGKAGYEFYFQDVIDPYLQQYLVSYWGGACGYENIPVSFYLIDGRAKQVCRSSSKFPKNVNVEIENTLSESDKAKWAIPQTPATIAKATQTEQPAEGLEEIPYKQLKNYWMGDLPKSTFSAPTQAVQAPENANPIPSQNKLPNFFHLIYKGPISSHSSLLLSQLRLQSPLVSSHTPSYAMQCLAFLSDSDISAVSTAVSLLLPHYLTTLQIDHILALLDVVKHDIDLPADERRLNFNHEQYLNMRLTVLEFAKNNGDTRYLDDLYNLYQIKRDNSLSPKHILEFQYKSANIRMLQKRYEDAIIDYTSCIKMLNQSSAISNSTRGKLLCTYNLCIANCYFLNGDIEKSNEKLKYIIDYPDPTSIEDIYSQAKILMQGTDITTFIIPTLDPQNQNTETIEPI